MLNIIGGTYFERCEEPFYYELYGSGLRAAAALSNIKEGIKLYSCIGKNDVELGKLICSTFNIPVSFSEISKTIGFNYYHPLAFPECSQITKQIFEIPFSKVKTDFVLLYGMVEASIAVNSSYLVYDPQNMKSFKSTGCKAEHLAVILNKNEAIYLSRLKKWDHLSQLAYSILKNEAAEVVVIKNGVNGAIVVDKNSFSRIPVFETNKVWPIGSGDIFSAVFAWKWMVEKQTPKDSAMLASKYTAFFCQSKLLPLPKVPPLLKKIIKRPKKRMIYLAGPFFTISERWLINEIRNILLEFNNNVFSPYHEVGVLNLTDEDEQVKKIVNTDLVALKTADVVLAIINGLDAGTLFEIGFAIAHNKKVVVLSENIEKNDLTMLEGSDCEITNDFSTAIYMASW